MLDQTESVTDGASSVLVTLALRDRGSDLLVARADLLRVALRLAMGRWVFRVDSTVILPARMHMIWHLSPSLRDETKPLRLMRTVFAQHVFADTSSGARVPLWHRGVENLPIRNYTALLAARAFCDWAPVHAGLASTPQGWALSSCQQGVGRSAAVLPSPPPPAQGCKERPVMRRIEQEEMRV